MTKSVHLTDRAMLDLDEIELYSVKLWGERVAACSGRVSLIVGVSSIIPARLKRPPP